MKQASKTIANLGVLALGFMGGSVLAGQGRALFFQNSAIFDVMQRLHREVGTDAIFVNHNNSARTFSLEGDLPRKQLISSAAKPYGLQPVTLDKVVVLEQSLADAPPGSSADYRLETAEEWLRGQVANASDAPGARMDGLVLFSLAADKQYQVLAADIGPGSQPFSALSPDQQAALLNIMDTQNTANASGWLQGVFDAYHSHPVHIGPNSIVNGHRVGDTAQ